MISKGIFGPRTITTSWELVPNTNPWDTHDYPDLNKSEIMFAQVLWVWVTHTGLGEPLI